MNAVFISITVFLLTALLIINLLEHFEPQIDKITFKNKILIVLWYNRFWKGENYYRKDRTFKILFSYDKR